MPTFEEDQLITAAAKSDPDALPLTDEQMSAMVPIRVLRGRWLTDTSQLRDSRDSQLRSVTVG